MPHRRPVEPGAATPRPAGWGHSGRNPFNGPPTCSFAIPKPVVEPAFPRLPEFDYLRFEPVTAPEIGHRHLRARRPPAFEFCHPLVELRAGSKHPGLPASPRADLRA